MLDLLKGTAINFLYHEPGAGLESVIARAREQGLEEATPDSLPGDVITIAGKWPGILLSPAGDGDETSAGPTGDPWVDSNGWRIRLAAALQPGKEVWVDVEPPDGKLSAQAYVLAAADAATYGGRWIISLSDPLAAAMAARQTEALAIWKKLTATAAFFVSHQDWPVLPAAAVLGIVSQFSGDNEFFSNELLNLIARTNQQYRIIPSKQARPSSFSGLHGIVYADSQPPSSELQEQLLAFVQNGGMLITGPKWDKLPGASISGEGYSGYNPRALGKGRIVVSAEELSDPYRVAQDSVVLLSHRYDVLRFWNGGAMGSFYTAAPGGKQAAVQMLFYASRAPHGYPPTVWISGRYRSASLWTLDQRAAQKIGVDIQPDAVEIHLPSLEQYAALVLQA